MKKILKFQDFLNEEINIIEEKGDNDSVDNVDSLSDEEYITEYGNPVDKWCDKLGEEKYETWANDALSKIKYNKQDDNYIIETTTGKKQVGTWNESFDFYLNERFDNELPKNGEEVEVKFREDEEVYTINKKLKPIKTKVETLNSLISRAIDKDGDAIPVIDNTSTYEMPTYYRHVTLDKGLLTISDKEMYGKKDWTEEIYDLNKYLDDEEENWFIFDDAKSELDYIIRMYKRAIKNAIKKGEMDEEVVTDIIKEEEELNISDISNELGIGEDEFEDSASLKDMARNMIEDNEEYEYALDEAENIFEDYLVVRGNDKIASLLTMEIPFKDIEPMKKEEKINIIFNDIKTWLNEDGDNDEYAYYLNIEYIDMALKQVISNTLNKHIINESTVIKFKDFK